MKTIIGNIEAIPDKNTILFNRGTIQNVMVGDEAIILSDIKVPFTTVEDNLKNLRGKAVVVFTDTHYSLAKISFRVDELAATANFNTVSMKNSALTIASVSAALSSLLGISLYFVGVPVLLAAAAAIISNFLQKKPLDISTGQYIAIRKDLLPESTQRSEEALIKVQ